MDIQMQIRSLSRTKGGFVTQDFSLAWYTLIMALRTSPIISTSALLWRYSHMTGTLVACGLSALNVKSVDDLE